MNCKQGDRFIVVKGRNSGKIGICLRLISNEERTSYRLPNIPVWECDIKIGWEDDGRIVMEYYVGDEYIRPLRDTDEEDEMLRVAGKPAIVENSTIAGKPKEKENIE